MSGWGEGYVTNTTYTVGFQRELSPAWLATAALILGHRPPALDRAFRYAELGCGHGLNVNMFAAAFPHAEFWGFDFNPAHIENARRLADAAGLTNAHFEEASFAELAARGDNALPDFDFITAHGVYSWVSREAQLQMIDFIRRRTKPGGLSYLGYNAMAGWAAILPLRGIMLRLLAEHPGPPEQAVPAIIAYLTKLKDAGGVYFANHPTAVARIGMMAQSDPRYFVHEYLNSTWTPFDHADVAADMADAKCSYIGTASLPDNINATSAPPGLHPLIEQSRDSGLREAVRDLASAQSFRRDIYRRGIEPLTGGEHIALLDQLAVLGLGRAREPSVTFATAIGQVAGREEVYRPLLALLDEGPLTFQATRQSGGLRNATAKDAIQAFTMLIAGGYAHPAVPAPATAPARRLNLEIARRTEVGESMSWLAAPAIASAIHVDPVDLVILADALTGAARPADEIIVHLQAALTRAAVHSNAPAAETAKGHTMIAERVAHILASLPSQVPLLRRLGVFAA